MNRLQGWDCAACDLDPAASSFDDSTAAAIGSLPATAAISTFSTTSAISGHSAASALSRSPSASTFGVDGIRLGNFPEGLFKELQGLVAIVQVFVLHLFRGPDRRGMMLEAAEDRFAVGLVASGVQNVGMPDVIDVFRGNKNRFGVPVHQGQELLVFVQCACDACFIPQLLAIAPLSFKRIIIKNFLAEVAQVETLNGFRQHSCGSFENHHHSPFMSTGMDPPL